MLFKGRDLLLQLEHSVEEPTISSGRGGEEEPVPTLDLLEAQKQVKRVILYLEQRVDTLRAVLDSHDRMLNLAVQFTEWKRNVKTVSVFIYNYLCNVETVSLCMYNCLHRVKTLVVVYIYAMSKQ